MSKKPTWHEDAPEYISELSKNDLLKLIEKKVVTVDDPVGNLRVGTIVAFLDRHPSFYAHGYAVAADKASDHRDHVVIEGVEGDVKVLGEMLDFLEIFWNATELEVEAKHCYAWFIR